MSSGQSLRNGSSVEPGLPNTRLMPKERSRSSVACLTVTDLLPVLPFFAMVSVPLCLSALLTQPSLRAQRSNPECRRGDSLDCFVASLLAMTRRDYHHTAVPFIVGCPSAFAVHSSMPPAVSLALMENSEPSNSGWRPR